MSTHVLTIWPAEPVPERHPSTPPERLAWGAAIALLAPVIVLLAAASFVDIAHERLRRRLIAGVARARRRIATDALR